MKTRIAFLLVPLLLLAGCRQATPSIEPPGQPITPLPSPDAVPIEVHCPLSPNQPEAAASMLPRAYRQGRCVLQFRPANDSSWPTVILTYPEGWHISLANPSATALLFELVGRVLFFQAFQSDLPLERADEVAQNLGNSAVEPAVHAEEVIKERTWLELDGKQVLMLTTTLSEQTIRRYFFRPSIDQQPVILMFQMTVTAPNLDNTMLIGMVENVIAELQLAPNQ